jgi:hypothetical protein
MVPREMITVSRFPLNSNGKIDRKAVINTYLASSASKRDAYQSGTANS